MAEGLTTPRLLRDITLGRVGNFLARGHPYTPHGLYSRAITHSAEGEDVVSLEVWSAERLERPPFAQVMKQAKWEKAAIGQVMGPSWSTHWYKVTINVPSEWVGKEVWLEWDPQCESMIFSEQGHVLQGMTSEGKNDGNNHLHFTLSKKHAAPHTRVLYIEVACNRLFGLSWAGIQPGPKDKTYSLQTARLIVPNRTAMALISDMEVLKGIAENTPERNQLGADCIWALNECIDLVWGTDSEASSAPESNDDIEKARKVAATVLSRKAGEGGHELFAIGNCHIDTAWLWPYAETRRKIARSFSRQLLLMDEYPDFIFTASQAVQFKWLQQDYPDLFERVKEKVKGGQFIPVGGTWIEQDCNMPSGEGHARQFLYGQRFFEKHFGVRSKIFWLPDTFGYSSQLPQIMQESDITRFFTQKMSWNNINKFPRTTFRWEGLCAGVSVLSHMAPSETYTAQMIPKEMLDSVERHRDLNYTNKSLLLYGNGDGGGGPLPSMIERAERLKSVDGMPKLRHSTPNEFYDALEKDSKKIDVWKGELYLEFHRGTYTSQAHIKKWNRKLEFLLREVELLATYSGLLVSGFKYGKAQIDEWWEDLLLNQFHDVLPGSCIEEAAQDAHEIYKQIEAGGEAMKAGLLSNLAGAVVFETDASHYTLFNSLPWERSAVVPLSGIGTLDSKPTYVLTGRVGSYGITSLARDEFGVKVKPEAAVSVLHDFTTKTFTLSNQHLSAVFNSHGQLVSLLDKALDRDLVPKGAKANIFKLYEDVPLFWDAWDIEIYHMNKYRLLTASSVSIHEEDPLKASLMVEIPVSKNSWVKQVVSLDAVSRRLDFRTQAEWHESRKLLKVEFEWDIYSDFASYETQFGFLTRPTHFNTTWDAAKFEVCCHKYADFSEFGAGVAILNESKYGFATAGNVMKLSLLRSPKAPDANCDMGMHEFSYAILPHTGTLAESDVVRQAYEFNVPLTVVPTSGPLPNSLLEKLKTGFTVQGAPNVVLETIKVAEDAKGAGDVVLRLYEAKGGHAKAIIRAG